MPLPPDMADSQPSGAGAASDDPAGGPAGLRAWLPPAVRDWAGRRGLEEPWWERMLLSAVALAGTAGARPVRPRGDDVLELELPDGSRFGLVVLVHPVDEHRSGHPDDVDRLIDALNATFTDRRYILYVRRRLPPDFDPAAIARAVRLWLAAVDRGEWQGRHAVYEDDAVAIELTLAGDRADDQSPLVLQVGPVRALEQLTALDARLVDLVDRYSEETEGLPTAYCIGCTRRSALPRGYVQQLLYGTADWISADTHEWHYRAAFSHTGRSLFSDPACSTVAGLWWLDPVGADGFRSMVLENPWSVSRITIPVSGARFQVVERPTEGAQVVLAWSERHPSTWAPDR